MPRQPASLIVGTFLLAIAASIPATAQSYGSEEKIIVNRWRFDENFGAALATIEGRLLVGAPGRGAVYIYTRDATGWLLEDTIFGSSLPDRFGQTLATLDDEEEQIVIGVPFGDTTVGVDGGLVELYRRFGTAWGVSAIVRPESGRARAEFGTSVATSGRFLIAGAPKQTIGGFFGAGSAFIYEKSGPIWIERAVLQPEDPSSESFFGRQVAIDGDLAFVAGRRAPSPVGAGFVAVFERQDDGSWLKTQEIEPSDSHLFDEFGSAIVRHGDLLLIGAPQTRGRALEPVVYEFRHDGEAWVEVDRIVEGPNVVGTLFGTALAVEGETLAVGAPLSTGALSATGRAFVFRRVNGRYVKQADLQASDGFQFDDFGAAITIHDGRVIVGARQEGYLFTRRGAVYSYAPVPNAAPTADAGSDEEVECTGRDGALVRLDGSASSDPDSTPLTNDDIVSFEWFEDRGMPSEALIATGEVVDVTLGVGSHLITLVVSDAAGANDEDDVVKAVLDSTAPALSVYPDPDELWPPNHRMVDVHLEVVAEDLCSTASVALESATSSEPDDAPGNGDGSTTGDIRDAVIGTADFDVRLRAERSGGGDGRIYTITYSAVDAAGNVSSSSGDVFVPHDRSGTSDPLSLQVTHGRAGTLISWGTVNEADAYDVIRGQVSSLGFTAEAISLGLATCIEAGSTDLDATSLEDGENAEAGDAFYYLVQYTTGDSSSGYGTESATLPREAESPACD